MGRSYALDGAVTDATAVGLTNGTRMLQTNGSRNFTAADGSSSWTLAADVNRTRQFRLNVTRASLTDAHAAIVDAPTTDAFFVHFDDGSTQWEVYVYKNVSTGDATVNVTVKNATADNKLGPCSAESEHVMVNLTAGTVGGEECSELSFVSDLDTPYAITYNDTEPPLGDSTGNGTYHLIVDDESVAAPPGPAFNDAPGNSPWADAAIYAVRFDAVYETKQLQYVTEIRIAPGETDE